MAYGEINPFIQFVETQPGLRRYAIAMYERVHRMAEQAGDEIKKRDVGMLRKRAADKSLSPNLRGLNEQMANALERDPSGKIAAIPSLYAWAQQHHIDRSWVTWWSALYCAYLDSLKSPSLVPLQATGSPLEMINAR